ncbi:hypothetical protein SO802_007538 [Lithocarpus litseifolius]|uniref:At2g24240-like C-terminal beta-propeller domain-containing protein n=1 Tax=Lithocarpus litseifolius TaxID=425828 RepID=A0AAW2DT42_9ROSI
MIASELGRQSKNSAKHIVPGKLTWILEKNLLVGTAVTSSTFSYSRYIRLWDARSGNVVWETSEPGLGRSSRFGDSLADVAVDTEESTLYKICSKSGDLGMVDVFKLGDDLWVYLKDRNPSMRNTTSGGGEGNSVIHCYKKQVFVGRGGGLEVWSRVEGRENGVENESEEGFLHGKNFVDKVAAVVVVAVVSAVAVVVVVEESVAAAVTAAVVAVVAVVVVVIVVYCSKYIILL